MLLTAPINSILITRIEERKKPKWRIPKIKFTIQHRKFQLKANKIICGRIRLIKDIFKKKKNNKNNNYRMATINVALGRQITWV